MNCSVCGRELEYYHGRGPDCASCIVWAYLITQQHFRRHIKWWARQPYGSAS